VTAKRQERSGLGSPIVLCLCALAALTCGPGTDRETRSGIYVWGHEVSAITFCDNASATYWVSGNTVPLRDAYEALRLEEPYTEVFVRVMGRFGAEATEGFAADYDGVFVVEKVVGMERLGPGSNCPE